MTGLITGFIGKYFMEAALAIIVTVFTKLTVRYFGNDRAAKIKETIITAMLYAEQTYGIGTGNEKYNEAWNKLVELLQLQGIKLSDKEKLIAEVEMESNVPEINSIVYSSLPEEDLVKRSPSLRSSEAEALVNKLKAKHPNPIKEKKEFKKL